MLMKTYTKIKEQNSVFEIISAVENKTLIIQGIVAQPSPAPFELLSALTGGYEKGEEDMAELFLLATWQRLEHRLRR
jgi:hypothetical protein